MEIWVILLVIAFIVLLLWKPASASYDSTVKRQAVSPDIIEVIIEAVQKNEPDMVPIETLYVNRVGDDQYSARLMFMNTRGYFGTQYDVRATVTGNGVVNITNLSTTSQVDQFDSGFSAYKPDGYRTYNDITASLEGQLAAAKAAGHFLHGFEQVPGQALAAVSLRHNHIMNIQKGPALEGGKSLKRNHQAGRDCAVHRQYHMGRGARRQRGRQLLLHRGGKSHRAPHRAGGISIQKQDDGSSMDRIRRGSFKKGDGHPLR
jgi:hypothetical protein